MTLKNNEIALLIKAANQLAPNSFTLQSVLTREEKEKTANDLLELALKQTDKKMYASIKANEWNKAHKERHNEINKKSYARKITIEVK